MSNLISVTVDCKICHQLVTVRCYDFAGVDNERFLHMACHNSCYEAHYGIRPKVRQASLLPVVEASLPYRDDI